jgi:hypothetical protein
MDGTCCIERRDPGISLLPKKRINIEIEPDLYPKARAYMNGKKEQ